MENLNTFVLNLAKGELKAVFAAVSRGENPYCSDEHPVDCLAGEVSDKFLEFNDEYLSDEECGQVWEIVDSMCN